jgi:hypothetical protein
MIKKTWRLTVRLVGEDAPDMGMGAGIVGTQEFSLYAKDETEAKSDRFRLAAVQQAEALTVNFIAAEIEEVA